MRIRKARFGGAVICALAMIIYMLAGISFPASADDENGSLTLICKSGDVVIADMDWSVYRIGAHLDTDEYVLQGDFAEYPVSLADVSASALQDAADTLENYAKLDSLVSIADGTTDENGELSFDGLENGLYLLSGNRLSIGATTYIPSAAIVEVKANEEGLLDWTVYPKFTQKDTSSSESSEYSVEKIWENDENANVRPESITVDIYADGELEDSVTLNESNGWKYEWTSENREAEWSVKEREVPNGYTVVYRTEKTQFSVVNTYNTTTTTTTSTTSTSTSSETKITTTTNDKLPQTGQLWWPVPILSLAGLVLISAGWRLHVKKEETQNDGE